MRKLLTRIWTRWIRIAELLGTLQILVVLSIVYWTLFMIVAIPFKILCDPLSIKSNRRIQWETRQYEPEILTSMRLQG